MKPKLRPTQHRPCSEATEWRSGDKAHGFGGRAGLSESVGCLLLSTFSWLFMFSHGQWLVYHL